VDFVLREPDRAVASDRDAIGARIPVMLGGGCFVELELRRLREQLACLAAGAGCPDRAVGMQGHAVAAGGALASGPGKREELAVRRVVAQPPIVGTISDPEDALGVDLRVAEALAILRGRAGWRIELGEFECVGIEAAELAGALGDPGVAL